MKTKKVTIQGKEYILKLGFGVMMEFEEQYNKPITSIKKNKELINLLFITLKYNNEDFEWDFKYFTDNILDEQPDLLSDLISLFISDEPVKEEDKKK